MPPSVACSAVNTSLTATPSACAFSRSMSRKMDGVVALNVLNARAIFGSPLAAATSPFSTPPISVKSRPSRFCN